MTGVRALLLCPSAAGAPVRYSHDAEPIVAALHQFSLGDRAAAAPPRPDSSMPLVRLLIPMLTSPAGAQLSSELLASCKVLP